MSKHTPGPWVVETTERNKYASGNAVGVGTSRPWRFQFTVGPEIDEEAQANAHLIAAAPELLAACETAIEYMTDFGIEPSEYVWEPLKKAIAKAKGEK